MMISADNWHAKERKMRAVALNNTNNDHFAATRRGMRTKQYGKISQIDSAKRLGFGEAFTIEFLKVQ